MQLAHTIHIAIKADVYIALPAATAVTVIPLATDTDSRDRPALTRMRIDAKSHSVRVCLELPAVLSRVGVSE